MDDGRITAILFIHRDEKKIDIDIPLKITAHELIIGLNQSYRLGIDTENVSKCFLKTENPIAFLRGNKTLEEYGMRNGTIINVL